MSLLSALCVLLLSCASAPPPPHDNFLQTTIDQLTTAPPFDRALWGIRIEEQDGTVLYERNAHALFMPASNRKLFSAATAAECLGLTTRLATDLYVDGEDVVIKGGGDPSFGSQRHESLGFGPFVDELRMRGVKSVRDIVVDVSRFDRVTIPGSWKSGNLISGVAAPVDAIAYWENTIGEFAVADAAIYAGVRFREELLFGGIPTIGTIRVNTTEREWAERIAAVQSPYVYQLLFTVLKNSHNLYAEMLLKLAGDGSYSRALERERQVAAGAARIDPRTIRFVDGSGLSPDDLVTPAAIVQMVRWMSAPERLGIWWELLAQPGGEGTLRRRLTTLSDRLRAKTGMIAGVNSLSGVIRMPSGRHRYFAIVVNHHTGDAATAVIDRIVLEVARWGGG